VVYQFTWLLVCENKKFRTQLICHHTYNVCIHCDEVK